MSGCRKWREHLVEAVCGELEGGRRRDFEAHLESCPGCAGELADLEATTAWIDGALPPRPQPGEVDVWKRIVAELDAPGHRRPARPRLVLGYPAAAAVATLLLALGLGLGLLLRPPEPEAPPSAPVARAPGSPVDAELAKYFERSTPLLLAIANRRTGGAAAVSFDPSTERRLAERLASDAARLGRKLEEKGRRRQADLLADLEIVFLQIANLPEREYRHGIEMVQATIESHALLFQLSVEEMRRL